jgi:hypothetical protein
MVHPHQHGFGNSGCVKLFLSWCHVSGFEAVANSFSGAQLIHHGQPFDPPSGSRQENSASQAASDEVKIIKNNARRVRHQGQYGYNTDHSVRYIWGRRTE